MKKFIGHFVDKGVVIISEDYRNRAAEQSEYKKLDIIKDFEQEIINFCLSCDKPKCKGKCKAFVDFKFDTLQKYRKKDGFNL